LGLEKGGPKYYELKDKLKNRREVQHEQSTDESLTSRFSFGKQAAGELRQREPDLTKEQAITEASFGSLGAEWSKMQSYFEPPVEELRRLEPYPARLKEETEAPDDTKE
jgi:hypothetical protein